MKCELAAILVVQAAFGQTETRMAFDKANVHVSVPGTREEGGFLPGGRFECRATTMLKLISVAYGVKTDQVVGGPAWLASDRFDIAAKARSAKASPAVLGEMLRTLLADRFGLVVENDDRDLPVYLLVVGPKGPKMQASAHPQTPNCPSVDGVPNMNHRACHDFGMGDLAKMLPLIARNYIDRPVIDTTGLTEFYNFRLDWTSKPTYVNAKTEGGEGVSLSDALAKLGLKLEAATRPLPAVVVKSVNPTPTDDPVKGTEPPPHFEVSEVRPSKAAAQRQGLSALPSGEVEILGYTVRDLMTLAFEVKADRIAGGPRWLDSDRFDVIAKSPDAMSPYAIGGMLKTLIVERFNLQTHSEDRPLPVFALVAPKETPKLRNSDGTARSQCDLVVADNGRTYNCRNTTMAQLVDRLPTVARAYFTLPTVDLTGLTGAYDFTLNWTPKNPRSDRRGMDVTVQAPTPTGGLTIFEAIERQLGLKVEERKHPLPVIVVDRAERPTAG